MITERRSIPVMFRQDRILPLPDISPVVREGLELQLQEIVEKDAIGQLDFERFGRNMVLLAGKYQHGNAQTAEAYGKDGNGEAWTIRVDRNLVSEGISFNFRNETDNHGIRWEKGNSSASSITTPHEEGIWASSKPQLSAGELRQWLKKGIDIYKSYDVSYHGDEWNRRRQIVVDRHSREAIYPKGLRDSYMHWGKRVYLSEEELYFPAPKKNILSFARLRSKKAKVF